MNLFCRCIIAYSMKRRLDLILSEKNYFNSRSKAQVHILAGEVYVNGRKECVPSKLVDLESVIEIKYLSENFVSRGGQKLVAALNHFKINVEDKICMDIGASTGGFSDCLLRFGAKKIYTVDVGYGQLDYKLRNNLKIVNIENTNARYITTSTIDDFVDIIVMDVSFISITKFDSFFEIFTAANNEYVGLIKPQFELGKSKLGKHGIVKDSSDRIRAVEQVSNFLKTFYNSVSDAIESPIKGSKGNTEYLIYCKNI